VMAAAGTLQWYKQALADSQRKNAVLQQKVASLETELQVYKSLSNSNARRRSVDKGTAAFVANPFEEYNKTANARAKTHKLPLSSAGPFTTPKNDTKAVKRTTPAVSAKTTSAHPKGASSNTKHRQSLSKAKKVKSPKRHKKEVNQLRTPMTGAKALPIDKPQIVINQPLVKPDHPAPIKLRPGQQNALVFIQAIWRGELGQQRLKKLKHKAHNAKATVAEMLKTERAHCAELQKISELVLDPLAKNKILPAEKLRAIFANWGEILLTNVKFLSTLELIIHDKALPQHEKHVRICEHFVSSALYFKKYAVFINNYDNAIALVKDCKQKIRPFANFMAEVDKKLMEHHTTFDYTFVRPVKRLPQYILLLKELKKNVTRKDRCWNVLEHALTLMEELADYVNTRKRNAENLNKIKKIQLGFIGRAPDLRQSGRLFVGEIEVHEMQQVGRPITKKIYLFNDALLFKQLPNGRFDRLVYLRSASVSKMGEDIMQIRVPKETYTLQLPNSRMRDQWVMELTHTIESLQIGASVLDDFASPQIQHKAVVSNKVIREGPLYKLTSKHLWVRRWFVLEESGLLLYFHNQSSKSPRSFFKMSDIFIRVNKTTLHVVIEFHTKKSIVLKLAADNQPGLKAWYKALYPYTIPGLAKANNKKTKDAENQEEVDLISFTSAPARSASMPADAIAKLPQQFHTVQTVSSPTMKPANMQPFMSNPAPSAHTVVRSESESERESEEPVTVEEKRERFSSIRRSSY